MAQHKFRRQSEKFEATRVAILRKKHFLDLEKDGHVVTRDSLNNTMQR
jgi:hypothetical protein